MGKTKVAADCIRKVTELRKLMNLGYVKELEIPNEDSFLQSKVIEKNGKLTRAQVYKLLIDGSQMISPPERTKTRKGEDAARCWQSGGLDIVIEQDGDTYYDTGYVIHHQRDANGVYCGWLNFQKEQTRRTSDLTKHVTKCDCGKGEQSVATGQQVLTFHPTKEATLSKKDVEEINHAMREQIFSNCRQAEIADDIMFGSFQKKLLEIGARQGAKGYFKFDFRKRAPSGSKVIRKGLQKEYEEIVSYWKPKIKVAVQRGLASFYTDIGKDKVNNRAMLNICCTISFPAIPAVTFDLVIATCSFNSALLLAAKIGEDVDLGAIAEEVFSKHGRHIRATFNAVLKETYDIETAAQFYVVADRAGNNVRGFGDRYICCMAHQYHNAFKYAQETFRSLQPDCSLVKSFEAVAKITTYAKKRDIKFKVEGEEGRRREGNEVNLENPPKTRWLGKVNQVKKNLKVKSDVQRKAEGDVGLEELVLNVSWELLEQQAQACGELVHALMNTQLTSTPNLHLVLPDLRRILRALLRIVGASRGSNEIKQFFKQLILGVAHKCLRVLDVIHYASAYLNPGSGGTIIDINRYLPQDQKQFSKGIESADYRTTHLCVKNEHGKFKPTQLKSNKSISESITDHFATRIDITKEPSFRAHVPQSHSVVNLDDSNEDLDEMLAGLNSATFVEEKSFTTPVEIADDAIKKYSNHHKGYPNHREAVNREKILQMKQTYDQDPRTFWANPFHRSKMHSGLTEYALFLFSIRSSSASSEREFSRMAWMLSKRRSSYTTSNTNRMLTCGNLIPQKRRLQQELFKRKVKQRNLFKSKANASQSRSVNLFLLRIVINLKQKTK